MKVVHYLQSLDLALGGGVVRSVIDMAGTLASAGHQITLFTHFSGDAPATWLDGSSNRVPDVRVLPPPDRLLGRFSRDGYRAILEMAECSDLLHLHAIWNPANLQLATLARRAGWPYVVTVHGMLGRWSTSQKPLKKRIYMTLGGRTFLEHASRVMFSCKDEREQASRWFDDRRSSVHPLPMDLGDFQSIPGPELCRESLSIPDDGLPTLLFLSTLKPVKGVEHAVDAVDCLRKEGVDCRLVIAGKGDDEYERMLRAKVRQLRLADRVMFVGYVRGDVKKSLLATADVNVLVSQHENFGFAWAESMAAGTPVVISAEVGPWRELVESGGAVLSERNGLAVAEACRKLLEDDTGRRRMGEFGRAFVNEYLNPAEVTGQIVSVYEQVRLERGK